jgi:hypothetical protein
VVTYVPSRYRNVINPWQTQKDVQSALFFIGKMMKDHPDENWELIMNSFNERGPDREW